MMHMGRKWTLGATSSGNGTKQFGSLLWGNGQRLGFQINIWKWEIQIMRDYR